MTLWDIIEKATLAKNMPGMSCDILTLGIYIVKRQTLVKISGELWSIQINVDKYDYAFATTKEALEWKQLRESIQQGGRSIDGDDMQEIQSRSTHRFSSECEGMKLASKLKLTPLFLGHEKKKIHGNDLFWWGYTVQIALKNTFKDNPEYIGAYLKEKQTSESLMARFRLMADNGLVHTDLNSGNIGISKEYTVMFLDWASSVIDTTQLGVDLGIDDDDKRDELIRERSLFMILNSFTSHVNLIVKGTKLILFGIPQQALNTKEVQTVKFDIMHPLIMGQAHLARSIKAKLQEYRRDALTPEFEYKFFDTKEYISRGYA